MNKLYLLLIIPILLQINLLSSEDQSHETLHKSKDANYTMTFPEKWEVMEGVMGTDVIALAPTLDAEDLFRENANVIFSKFDFPITRDEYYSYNINSLHELLTDFDLEGTQDVKLGGIDAKKVLFTHRIGVVNARVIQYLVLVDKHAFVISFTADPIDYPNIKGEFETIAKSFKFM